MLGFLKKVVIDDSTKMGRTFDLFIQVLILLSLVSFSLETLPDLSIQMSNALHTFEVICVTIFSIEYILRVVFSKRFSYLFTFFGIIDIVAILPFYLSTGIDLRSVRIFRLLRIFRAFKLLKYSKAVDRMANAFNLIKTELFIFTIATSFVLYLAAVGIYYFENPAQPEQFKSIFHSLWWAVTTLTTVGYGDMYPITTGGKVFATFIVFIGLGLVAIPSGLLATAFTNSFKNKK
tara:strand:- start:8 stop:709 length:702 start_codon:yes stop_codon:yes gene_type:complete